MRIGFEIDDRFLPDRARPVRAQPASLAGRTAGAHLLCNGREVVRV